MNTILALAALDQNRRKLVLFWHTPAASSNLEGIQTLLQESPPAAICDLVHQLLYPIQKAFKHNLRKVHQQQYATWLLHSPIQ